MTDIRLNILCTPIESDTAKCHPDLGDGRTSYYNNGYYIFERSNQWYVVLERQDTVKMLIDGIMQDVPTGNFTQELTMERIKLLVDLFGWDNLIEYNNLPKEEEV